jgi:hypothetical protein
VCICACAQEVTGMRTAGRSRAIPCSPDRRRPAARSRCTCRWRRPRAPAPGDCSRPRGTPLSTGPASCRASRARRDAGPNRCRRGTASRPRSYEAASPSAVERAQPELAAGRQAEGIDQQETILARLGGHSLSPHRTRKPELCRLLPEESNMRPCPIVVLASRRAPAGRVLNGIARAI